MSEVYTTTNLPGLICRKAADFLFGDAPSYSAGSTDYAEEQKVLERLVDSNDLNRQCYESAVSNAYRGDAFFKVRWGQEFEGLVESGNDPFRIFIESQNPTYVFPQSLPSNNKKIFAYHIAIPRCVDEINRVYILDVETHLPGKITYATFDISVLSTSSTENKVVLWKIQRELKDPREDVITGVPFPLVVHIPNSAEVESWEGVDDLSEHINLFEQINRRLSKIGLILDKHSDPAIAIPDGMLGEDEDGSPIFNVARDKAIEISKDEIMPQYITWNGQIESAFKHLDLLIDQVLTNAELPPVALGKGNSGTSGSSGSAILARMNTLIAKIKRKRQYFEAGLKQVLYIAQLLEKEQLGDAANYEARRPKIIFRDGLPTDEKEMAVVSQIRTAGRATISIKTVLMETYGMTEDKADLEIERMRAEEQIFDGVVPALTEGDPYAAEPVVKKAELADDAI